MGLKTMIAASAVTLAAGGLALAATPAFAATPLPPYPSTTTLDLGSPNCVTDDVIMNDPLDSTSPITDTAGSTGAGSPVVYSHATPPITYWLSYLDNTTNLWVGTPPPGTQFNSTTGELAAYNPSGDAPQKTAAGWGTGVADVHGTNSYTVRENGSDSVGGAGVEQFQVTVNDSGSTSSEVTTVTYEGNTFNNANGALTIQLNSTSTTSTTLTLAAIASSLNIPNVGNKGSTPVTFMLVGSVGWRLNGGSTGTVLTGTNASDPEIEATTPDGDVVFFTLSGISTTSGGVFYANSDANPCVTGPVTPVPVITTPPPVSSGNYGDMVNKFGNGFDVFQQHYVYNGEVAGWTATQHDPATNFYRIYHGSNLQFEAALPGGTPSGLCVSDPGAPDHLVLRTCNNGPWQQFIQESNGTLKDVATGLFVNPNGTGAPLTGGVSPSSWGGSVYTWTDNAHLPA